MKLRLPTLCSASLGLLLLAVLLPFLNYLRFAPLADWFSDATAVTLLALSAGVLLFKRDETKLAAHPAELWLWLFTAGLAIELLLHRPQYLQAGMLPIGVLALAAFAAGGVRHSVQELGQEKVLTALAGVLLVGALVQSCLGLTQVLGLAPLARGYIVFDVGSPTTLLGNIGQRNQFAHYLSWGLISACYLRGTGRLRAWLFIPCCVILALMMAWSSSRLVLAYGLGMAAIAWIWLRRSLHDPQIELWARSMAIAVLAIAATQLFITEINQGLASLGLPIHGQSGAQRIMETGFGARRRIEWMKAWAVFKEHPLIGVGWGGYAAQSVQLEATGLFGHYPEPGLFTQAHNFIAQLLAETGLLGTVPALAGMGYCLAAFFRRAALGPDSGCVLAMLMVSIGHSLFEYPLWYPPFLVGVVIMLALSPAPLVPVHIRRWLRVGLAGSLALAALAFVINGYFVFWVLVNSVSPTPNVAENQHRIVRLVEVGRDPLWWYESDVLLSNYLQATPDQIKLKRALFERLASYRPYHLVLLKLAVLQAYDGDIELAKLTLRRTIAAYPDFTPSLYAILAPYKSPLLTPLKKIAEQASGVFQQGGVEAVATWASASVSRKKS
jgi:O-antigen ligase